MVDIPLNPDRLWAGIAVLCDPPGVRSSQLFVSSIVSNKARSSSTPRPAQVPIGLLSELCVTLSRDITEQVDELQPNPQSCDCADSSLINIGTPEHLGIRRGSGGVFGDPVKDLNDHVRS